jgi:hypothetical protein
MEVPDGKLCCGPNFGDVWDHALEAMQNTAMGGKRRMSGLLGIAARTTAGIAEDGAAVRFHCHVKGPAQRMDLTTPTRVCPRGVAKDARIRGNGRRRVQRPQR